MTMTELSFNFERAPRHTVVTFLENPGMDTRADLTIIDSSVASIYGKMLSTGSNRIEIPGGELSKTPETLNELWKRMADAKLRRDSRVTVIGGGTLCDVGAFAASTWKRGIQLTLVPTTLLCMVDASLGGKTAVNIGREKNQAGTVYPAGRILIWPGFLETLPGEEMKNGMAEALKTAVIGNRNIMVALQREDYARTVMLCLGVKGEIVAEDLEESGRRKLLNLGHTAGHCIEAASKFAVPHGQAVAMGIPVAARMCGSTAFAEEFETAANGLGIETQIPFSITVEEALSHLDADKKTSEAGRTWVFPRDWEQCELVDLHPEEEKRLLMESWR